MVKIYKIPVSVKGIIFEDGKVWLRKNERKEWELPGGKLDEGEQPEKALVRELLEELGLGAEVIDIIQANLYLIKDSINKSHEVLVVSYLCKLLGKSGTFELEGEAGKARFKKFHIHKLVGITMPKFYKDAILKAWERIG